VLPAAYRYWDGFWHLTHSRSVGFAVGAIPVDAIVASLDGIAEVTQTDERYLFLRMIGEMDTRYRLHISKEKPKKRQTL
jgi:hypothetical protein